MSKPTPDPIVEVILCLSILEETQAGEVPPVEAINQWLVDQLIAAADAEPPLLRVGHVRQAGLPLFSPIYVLAAKALPLAAFLEATAEQTWHAPESVQLFVKNGRDCFRALNGTDAIRRGKERLDINQQPWWRVGG